MGVQPDRVSIEFRTIEKDIDFFTSTSSLLLPSVAGALYFVLDGFFVHTYEGKPPFTVFVNYDSGANSVLPNADFGGVYQYVAPESFFSHPHFCEFIDFFVSKDNDDFSDSFPAFRAVASSKSLIS